MRQDLDRVKVWYECFWPQAGMEVAIESLRAIKNNGGIADVSRSTMLWGQALSDFELTVAVTSSIDHSTSLSRTQASDIVAAEIVQFLSALQGRFQPIYVVDIKTGIEPDVVDGILESCTLAKNDGLLAGLGLRASGPELAAMLVWQFNHAFDLVLAPKSYSQVRNLACERKVKLIETNNADSYRRIQGLSEVQ